MHLLELFSGTGSVGHAFSARGWEVTSVDCDPRAGPTICIDVLAFHPGMLNGRKVDLIWASPPCTHYSAARTKARTPRDLEGADRLVRKALELAEQLGCPYLMENPHSGLLKSRACVADIPMRVVDYCKYGAPYRKRTAIFTNTAWEPARPLCRHDCHASAGGRHTARAQRGMSLGTRGFALNVLYALPAELCEEIADWATSTYA